MKRGSAFCTAMALSLGGLWLAGCGQGASSDAANAANGNASASARPTDPAAQVAYDFFAAILAGDSQQASAQLTPQAIQGFIDRNEQFAPVGVDNSVGFRVGRIARPANGVALVQCISSEAAPGQSSTDKEVCVLLKMVGDEWRVCGFAHESGPNQPMMLLNYETGAYGPIPLARSAAPAPPEGTEPLIPADPAASMSAPSMPAASRPSPPRTGDEPAAPAIR